MGRYHCPNSFPMSGLPFAFWMRQNRIIDKRASPEIVGLIMILAFSLFDIYNSNKTKNSILLSRLVAKAIPSIINIFS